MSHFTSLLWALLAWQAVVSCALPEHSLVSPTEGTADDPGKPLFLTPYLERGDIAEARRLARVTPNEILQIESYSGFFTVNKDYDSNQFFWYFPSMSENREEAPVLVWLQGGPGATSLFGLFVENGPIKVEDKEFRHRKYHWALNHHVIYIDNPVGAGFSFTNNEKGYCTDETQVGDQLYSTVTQFFQLFPELQRNKFFITGESYAGKYVPALAHTILKKDGTAKTKINLKGLCIGGAWLNPDTQEHYWRKNNDIGKLNSIQDFYSQGSVAGLSDNNDYIEVLTSNAVRKAIHVGDLEFDRLNVIVFKHLLYDYQQTMAPWLSELLDHYPVILYGGEKDDIVRYAGIVDFLLNHFNFTGVEEYRKAKQYKWKVDDELAGCVRHAQLLTDIYIYNATHYVPKDQPRWAWDMITRITHGKGFDQVDVCPPIPTPRPHPDFTPTKPTIQL